MSLSILLFNYENFFVNFLTQSTKPNLGFAPFLFSLMRNKPSYTDIPFLIHRYAKAILTLLDFPD